MPTDPNYVRLAEPLSDRSIADVEGGSGWGISGNEVKEFPPEWDEAAVRFARSALARGVLEQASKSEADEVNAIAKEYAKAAEAAGSGASGHQEEVLRKAADHARQRQLGLADEAQNPKPAKKAGGRKSSGSRSKAPAKKASGSSGDSGGGSDDS